MMTDRLTNILIEEEDLIWLSALWLLLRIAAKVGALPI